MKCTDKVIDYMGGLYKFHEVLGYLRTGIHSPEHKDYCIAAHNFLFNIADRRVNSLTDKQVDWLYRLMKDYNNMVAMKFNQYERELLDESIYKDD